MYTEDQLLPISALQHLIFCVRQYGLIVVRIERENRLRVPHHSEGLPVTLESNLELKHAWLGYHRRNTESTSRSRSIS